MSAQPTEPEDVDSDLEGSTYNLTIHSEAPLLSRKRKGYHSEPGEEGKKEPNKKRTKFEQDEVDLFLESDATSLDDNDNLENESEHSSITFFRPNENTTNGLDIIDFEMKDMSSDYYDEVHDILAATDFDQKKLHVSQLATTIVSQVECGGVLVSDTAVLGFITCLSFQKHYEHLSLGHIKRFCRNKMEKNKGKGKAKKFDKFFERNVGVILYERPLNVPLELSGPIFDALNKDIVYASSEECEGLSEEERRHFVFDYFMMIVKYRWVEREEEKEEEEKEKEVQEVLPEIRRTRNKMRLIYDYPEMQFFVEKARFTFTFERNDKVWNVVFVKAEALKYAIDRCKQEFKD